MDARTPVQAWLPGLEAPGLEPAPPPGLHRPVPPLCPPPPAPPDSPSPPAPPASPAEPQSLQPQPQLDPQTRPQPQPRPLSPKPQHQPLQSQPPQPAHRLLLSPAADTPHPAVWRAHQLGRHGQAVQPSGFAALDAQLPGGGWPAQVLTELLLPHPGVGELRLLAPALADVQQQQRCVMWFDPPAEPCAWSLGALGIDVRQLVLVRARQVLKSNRARQLLPAADILWAVEQALKSGHVGALLAWLPARLPADALRRLQLAAQAHEGPVFLLRDAPAHLRAGNARLSAAGWAGALPPSPAPLRLLIGSGGPDVLTVRLLKRRGPPLADALTLALPPVLSESALDHAQQAAADAACSTIATPDS